MDIHLKGLGPEVQWKVPDPAFQMQDPCTWVRLNVTKVELQLKVGVYLQSEPDVKIKKV
jgi:hypothetical protein